MSYQPINCDYYDRLEAWATRKTLLDIHFKDADTDRRINATIIDLYVRDHVEYMKLSTNEVIRLDALIAINDGVTTYKLPNQYC